LHDPALLKRLAFVDGWWGAGAR